MSRRFQFSLARSFLATTWLSLAALSLGTMAHAHPDPHTHVDRVTDVAAVFLGMLVGIVGAIGALTGTVALRHSLYSAGAAIAVGVALIAIAPWVHRMDPKTFFVALLSGMALAVGWLLVRSRRRGREH